MSSPQRRRPFMAHKRKTQGASDRRRFNELDRDRITQPMRVRRADKGAAGFVEAEIFVADQTCRDEAVSAGVVELDKETGAGDAGNMAVEDRADPIGKEMCDQPV